MPAKDKYTVFTRHEPGYRKGIHKVPKWTRVRIIRSALLVCLTHDNVDSLLCVPTRKVSDVRLSGVRSLYYFCIALLYHNMHLNTSTQDNPGSPSSDVQNKTTCTFPALIASSSFGAPSTTSKTSLRVSGISSRERFFASRCEMSSITCVSAVSASASECGHPHLA